MTDKHTPTPGPWTLCPDNEEVRGADGTIVHAFWDCGDSGVAEADATLIARAPEMAEEIERLRDQVLSEQDLLKQAVDRMNHERQRADWVEAQRDTLLEALEDIAAHDPASNDPGERRRSWETRLAEAFNYVRDTARAAIANVEG